MNTNPNPKKKHIFYPIYFTVLILGILALVIFLFWLNGWVRAYNKTLPETASKRVFDELFVTGDAQTLRQYTGVSASPFETEDNISAYFDKLFADGTLSYSSVTTLGEADENVKSYIVVKTPEGGNAEDGEVVANFTLKRGDDKVYALDNVQLREPKKSAHTYEILLGSKLYLNGREVTDEYLDTDVVPTFKDVSALVGDSVPGTRGAVYTVPDMICPPDVKVIDRAGRETTVDENNREIVLNDENEAFADFVLTAAKRYAACMQADASKASVLKYYEPGTDVYRYIETEENYFVWDHNGYDFKDEKVSDIFCYDDKTVSARVSFTHILHRTGAADYPDYMDITFFAHVKDDGSYKIFAQNNG